MSTSTLEQEERADTVQEASESEEDQLWHLKAAIRSEHPKGLFFIGKDGLITNEPWVLVDIIRKPLILPSGETHEGHVVQVRRMSGKGDTEEYALGDFMEHRLARTGDKR
jgi:hypothetical protein